MFRATGYKEYEINNHLGNVLATFTDRKVPIGIQKDTIIDYFTADINTLTDYYPFGAQMPGRYLAVAPCSTKVSTVTNTVVNETFASGTGSFTALGSATLSNASGVLKILKAASSTGWGGKRSFNQINGVVYNLSFTLGLGTCTGKTINLKVFNQSGTQIGSTQSYTTAGSKSYSFTANQTGIGWIEITMASTAACDFNIDNVLITYDSQTSSQECASGNDKYPFGYDAQMKDDEIYGDGNAYSFEYRIHDPRIGRFFSIDPLFKDYPWNSPYAFAENDVIRCKDLEGAEKEIAIMAKNSEGKLVVVNTFTLEKPGPLGEGTLTIWATEGYDYSVSIINSEGKEESQHISSYRLNWIYTGAGDEESYSGSALKADVINSAIPAQSLDWAIEMIPNILGAKASASPSSTTTGYVLMGKNKKWYPSKGTKGGEWAKNQADEINWTQNKLKKQAPPGQKQRFIEDTKKSDQNLKSKLKNLKDKKDSKEEFDVD